MWVPQSQRWAAFPTCLSRSLLYRSRVRQGAVSKDTVGSGEVGTLGNHWSLVFVTLSWVQPLFTLRALKTGKSYQPQSMDDLKGPKTAFVAIQKAENKGAKPMGRLCP